MERYESYLSLAVISAAIIFAGCNPEVATPTPPVTTYYADIDGDTFGDPAAEHIGDDPGTGWVTNNTDCDDDASTGAAINTAASEVENTLDDNCDGIIDEGFMTYYKDADDDGFGNELMSSDGKPDNTYILDHSDCDDSNASVNTAATEVANAIDDNCDGVIDEGFTADDGFVDDGTYFDDGTYPDDFVDDGVYFD
ncbi:MAG: hypothetical protein HRU20_24060 [Pseudomonadales bacterium]|nr:hypothetical protein [Pseudomonadales bacterium]